MSLTRDLICDVFGWQSKDTLIRVRFAWHMQLGHDDIPITKDRTKLECTWLWNLNHTTTHAVSKVSSAMRLYGHKFWQTNSTNVTVRDCIMVKVFWIVANAVAVTFYMDI